MKIIIILLSSVLLTLTAHATNSHKESGHSKDEATTNGLSSGKITDNIIVNMIIGRVLLLDSFCDNRCCSRNVIRFLD